jgi:hypothetical protein
VISIAKNDIYDKIKEDEMLGTSGAYGGRKEQSVKNFGEDPKGKEQL